jgi:ATP-dependent Clp protease adaptor protein ClpS
MGFLWVCLLLSRNPQLIPNLSPGYPQQLAGVGAAAYNTRMIIVDRAQTDPPRVQPRPPQRPRADLLPPWKVLLHNDDVHTMDYVVASLMKAVPVSMAEAMRIMLEAHTDDVALVIVCPQETAEYYQDRLLTFGLHSTIEPA